jgi:hypothetical protein
LSTKEAYLTSKHEFEQDIKRDVEARVREGAKAPSCRRSSKRR